MDTKAKKKVLRLIPYGSYVVGTKTEEGKEHLMFGTWLMQTSFKPPLVAFAFQEDSRTLENVRRTKAFAVSFLTDGMNEVAELVLDGSFDKVETQRIAAGLPVVRRGAGWIECRALEILDRGDHRLVHAEVVQAEEGRGKLLPLDALGWHYGG